MVPAAHGIGRHAGNAHLAEDYLSGSSQLVGLGPYPEPLNISHQQNYHVSDHKGRKEAYERDKDRRPLLNAVKEQFLLSRLAAASKAEAARDLAIQVLQEKMEHMPDTMLLKTIKVLSEAGAPDLTTLTATPVPRGRAPMVSIQQAFGFPGGGSQSSLGDRTASNPIKEAGMLVEAVERITSRLRDEATQQEGE
jgi:hypothetical protein